MDGNVLVPEVPVRLGSVMVTDRLGEGSWMVVSCCWRCARLGGVMFSGRLGERPWMAASCCPRCPCALVVSCLVADWVKDRGW